MEDFWSSCHEFYERKIAVLPEVTILVNSYPLGLRKWVAVTLFIIRPFFGQDK